MTVTRTKPRLRRIEVPETGAEDVVIDADGNAWTGTEDGSIFRVSPDGSAFPPSPSVLGGDTPSTRLGRRAAAAPPHNGHRRRIS